MHGDSSDEFFVSSTQSCTIGNPFPVNFSGGSSFICELLSSEPFPMPCTVSGGVTILLCSSVSGGTVYILAIVVRAITKGTIPIALDGRRLSCTCFLDDDA